MTREPGAGWVRFAAAVLYPLTALLADREQRGLDRIPPRGGALLVLNHVSHLDPLYDGVLVHRHGRMPRFLAKQGLFERPVVGQVMRAAGQIPVYRDTAGAQDSLRDARRALAAGEVVVIYPEGTITRDPHGWPMTARTGVARLALDCLASGIPVLPAARWGTLAVLDLYHHRFRPLPRGRVVTAVGEPADLSAYRDRSVTNELLREITDLLMRRVTGLLAEIRGETPPRRFYRWPAPGADGAATSTHR